MINTIDIAYIVLLVTAKCKIMDLKSGDGLKETSPDFSGF